MINEIFSLIERLFFVDAFPCELCGGKDAIKIEADGASLPNHQYHFLGSIPIIQAGTDCWGKFYIPCPACNIKVKRKLIK